LEGQKGVSLLTEYLRNFLFIHATLITLTKHQLFPNSCTYLLTVSLSH